MKRKTKLNLSKIKKKVKKLKRVPSQESFGSYTPPNNAIPPVPPETSECSGVSGINSTSGNSGISSLPLISASCPTDTKRETCAKAAEEIAQIFAKHNKAVNMKYNEDKPKTLSYHWYMSKYWLYDHNPFNKWCSVSSVEELDKKPLRQKHTFLFWYNEPMLRGDGTSATTIFGKKKDREALKAHMKKKYFIQYPLRQWGFTIKCRLSSKWDALCHFLNPRQKWLTKQIPKSWADKTWLICELNFAMVVDFIEGEDALNVTDWEASSEQASQFEKELKDCYDYIKVRRPSLQAQFDSSYPDEETRTGDYNIDYAENNRLEVEINKQDTKYLTWIVVNRDFFWT